MPRLREMYGCKTMAAIPTAANSGSATVVTKATARGRKVSRSASTQMANATQTMPAM